MELEYLRQVRFCPWELEFTSVIGGMVTLWCHVKLIDFRQCGQCLMLTWKTWGEKQSGYEELAFLIIWKCCLLTPPRTEFPKSHWYSSHPGLFRTQNYSKSIGLMYNMIRNYSMYLSKAQFAPKLSPSWLVPCLGKEICENTVFLVTVFPIGSGIWMLVPQLVELSWGDLGWVALLE